MLSGWAQDSSRAPQGESDLIERDGDFYLLAVCDVPEEPLNENPAGFIGVDLGIANIATISTGHRAAGVA